MQRGKSSRPDSKYASGGSQASSECFEESGPTHDTTGTYSPSAELLQRSKVGPAPAGWPMAPPTAYYMPATMYHSSHIPYSVLPVRPRAPAAPVPSPYPFSTPPLSNGISDVKSTDDEVASSSACSDHGSDAHKKLVSVSADSESGDSKQPCTFFLRTGTCAYGDKCKFQHPKDRPPPQLNTRGLPLRSEEPDCSHYLKKGWCAFGVTCKFNHPEHAPPVPSMAVPFSQPAYVAVPANVMPVPYYYPYPHFQPTSMGPVPMYPPASSAYMMPPMQSAQPQASRAAGQSSSADSAAHAMQRLRLSPDSMGQSKSTN